MLRAGPLFRHLIVVEMKYKKRKIDCREFIFLLGLKPVFTRIKDSAVILAQYVLALSIDCIGLAISQHCYIEVSGSQCQFIN